jgi:hypothetical protein
MNQRLIRNHETYYCSAVCRGQTSRQDNPAFPMHFPWFGTADYWRGQCDSLREQMGLMA